MVGFKYHIHILNWTAYVAGKFILDIIYLVKLPSTALCHVYRLHFLSQVEATFMQLVMMIQRLIINQVIENIELLLWFDDPALRHVEENKDTFMSLLLLYES